MKQELKELYQKLNPKKLLLEITSLGKKVVGKLIPLRRI
jgi:hypothetical protein